MRTHARKAFTLVEIPIVVVILGILAAIVVPQFTSASQDAIKGALASQLQTINSQVELYRVQNAGTLPHDDPNFPMLAGVNEGSPQWQGWGVLVENDFLKDEPRNGYTNSEHVENSWTGDPATDGTAAGWAYNENTGEVFANGFDPDDNLLANEAGYVDPAPF